MQDLKAIYTQVKGSISIHCKEYFEFGKNFQLYPRQSKMSDVEGISLSITAKCV